MRECKSQLISESVIKQRKKKIHSLKSSPNHEQNSNEAFTKTSFLKTRSHKKRPNNTSIEHIKNKREKESEEV